MYSAWMSYGSFCHISCKMNEKMFQHLFKCTLPQRIKHTNQFRNLSSCKHHQSSHREAKERSQTNNTKTEYSPPANAAIKSIEDLVGPACLPMVGTGWLYWRWLGPYTRNTFHLADIDMYEKYGPIYRERRGGCLLVSIHNAKDIEKVFLKEGPKPYRVINEALVYKRLQQPQLYPTVGLTESIDDDWLQLRRKVGPILLKPKEAVDMLEHVNGAAQDLVRALLQHVHQTGTLVPDLTQWTVRYGTEVIWRTVLGEDFGALSSDTSAEVSKDTLESSRLPSLALRQFNLMADIRLGSNWWKTFPSLSLKYQQFASVDEQVSRIVRKQLEQGRSQLHCKKSNPENSCHRTLLGKLAKVPNLDQRDADTIIVDFFSAGVTTTASSLVLLLHRLGQEAVHPGGTLSRLQHELDTFLPCRDTPITADVLQQMTYLKAVVKEGFRLVPIIPSLIRILPQPIDIGGYRIPAYTPIIAKTRAACLHEHNFTRPLQFIPERWLPSRHKTEGGPSDIEELRAEAKLQQFLVKPFGFGKRMCVGTRLAEYEIYAALAKILRNFDVRSTGDIALGNFLFLAPLHPVPVTLIPRK